MLLQEAGSHSRSDLDPSTAWATIAALCSPKASMYDLPGVQDRTDPHRDGASWHVLFAEEVAGGVDACDAIQRDQPRSTSPPGPRLVEADVTGSTDAQNLHVNATAIPRSAASYCSQNRPTCSSGSVPSGMWMLARIDIDQVEQVLLHEPHIALQLVRLHRKILIQIESHHIGERQALFSMQADQFVVDPDRRGSGRQAPAHNVAVRRPAFESARQSARPPTGRPRASSRKPDRGPFRELLNRWSRLHA